ncbi:MAG: asparagine synthase (glutamine-hydrolyzing) [Acidimicrobiia bacterium]|nr:asparagine synthase (glutamine-hydrolyzing) [Acidimicrobiia bacterium]
MVDANRDTPAPELLAGLGRMVTTLVHRGPDAEGSWVDAEVGVALGFRRLAIIDLTETGAQPMRSASGRWVVVFNGELYSHRTMRARLEAEGERFRGRSDTEVLVAAIDRWGLRPALEEANGMFALAAWDRAERRLLLARDRLGEKPLYYGWAGGRFVFASELAALRACPGFDDTVDDHALAGYLRLTHVPAPRTIHRGARTLPAGHLLEIRANSLRPGEWPPPTQWWSPGRAMAEGLASPFAGSIDDAAEQAHALLADAVAIRLDSDVPLGCFLSGGLDSSLVTALTVQARADPVRTFTVRMPELGFDESEDAARVATHLGTRHETIDLTVAEALAAVPRLPAMYGEPFGDPSALPTALVCSAARRAATVALGGDGGDEMFLGYNRYVLGDRLWRRVRRVPLPLRAAAARVVALPSPATVDRLATLAPGPRRVRNPGDKLQKLARVLRAPDGQAVGDALVEEWRPEDILAHPPATGPSPPPPGGPSGFIPALAHRDLATTLPDQMLVKVDRASMAVGLEVRSPLLDHRLLGLVWSMPLAWHLDQSGGKRVLRRVLLEHVPAGLVDRPKMGFDPPIGTWLRGPLREWASDLLHPATVDAAGLRADVLRERWDEHQSGRRNHDYALWTVLQYLAWRASP